MNFVKGHVYAIVAPKGNEEGIGYWLARCVEKKYKLTQPQCDDDGFIYPIGLYNVYLCFSSELIIYSLDIFLYYLSSFPNFDNDGYIMVISNRFYGGCWHMATKISY